MGSILRCFCKKRSESEDVERMSFVNIPSDDEAMDLSQEKKTGEDEDGMSATSSVEIVGEVTANAEVRVGPALKSGSGNDPDQPHQPPRQHCHDGDDDGNVSVAAASINTQPTPDVIEEDRFSKKVAHFNDRHRQKERSVTRPEQQRHRYNRQGESLERGRGDRRHLQRIHRERLVEMRRPNTSLSVTFTPTVEQTWVRPGNAGLAELADRHRAEHQENMALSSWQKAAARFYRLSRETEEADRDRKNAWSRYLRANRGRIRHGR